MPQSAEPASSSTAAMFHLITGFWVSQAVGTAAALGIADQLAGGARDSDDLAQACRGQPGRPAAASAIAGQRRRLRGGRPGHIRADAALGDAPLGRIRIAARLRGHAVCAWALAALGTAPGLHPERPTDRARGARDGALRLLRATP